MSKLSTPACDFGWSAPNFYLLGTDNKSYSIKDCVGTNGLLIMFICNHCPYVKTIIDLLVTDCDELSTVGIGSVAIMSNDITTYPEDSFDNMINFAKRHNFNFPYLFDTNQDVARSYGAVCTPDFFGFNDDLKLQYRGRFDSSEKYKDPSTKSELFTAMIRISKTGCGPKKQTSSVGCSLKWKK